MTDHVIPSLASQAEKVNEKSCESCKMFAFKGGLPWCIAFSKVLATTNMNSNQTQLAFQIQAKNCPSYPNGKTRVSPLAPHPIAFGSRLSVGESDPRKRPYSCVSCIYFADPGVIPNLGLKDSFGICSARGIAVNLADGTDMAKACDIGVKGETLNLEDALSIRLVPELDVQRLQKLRAADYKHLPDDFDPETYPTDIPVQPYQKDMGIRAWIKIKDRKTTNTVALPIYDKNFFSVEEQKKIPHKDDGTYPHLYVDHGGYVFTVAVAWVELDETPALVGEAGTGKTELLRHMAWIMQLPFERITITASSEVDDLAGKMMFVDGETKFLYGRVSRAWAKPNVICLDEPNTGPNDVLQFIRPLTDNSKQLVLDQNEGELLQRNAGCFLGLAMNPSHDIRNIGANPLADADNSRLLHVMTTFPPKDIERKIIADRVLTQDGWEIPDVLLDTVMRISELIRNQSKQGNLPFSWGIRLQIKVARLLKWFDFIDAYTFAVAASVDEEYQQRVLDIVKAQTPSGPRSNPRPSGIR